MAPFVPRPCDGVYVGIINWDSSAGAGLQNTRSYEAEYNQRNNDIKSSTIEGRLIQGNMKLYNGHSKK